VSTQDIIVGVATLVGGGTGLSLILRTVLRRPSENPVAAETERVAIKDDAALRSEMWRRIRELEAECRTISTKAMDFAARVAALEADLRAADERDRERTDQIAALEHDLATVTAERDEAIVQLAEANERARALVIENERLRRGGS
jgi:chromosome segregation ATPase